MYVFVKECICHIIFSMVGIMLLLGGCVALKVTPLYKLPFLEYFWSFCMLLGIAAVCDLP